MTSTVAPLTRAPLASLTTPVIPPVWLACANTLIVQKRLKINALAKRSALLMEESSFSGSLKLVYRFGTRTRLGGSNSFAECNEYSGQPDRKVVRANSWSEGT